MTDIAELVERLRVSVNELMQIARQDYTQEDPTTGEAFYSEGRALMGAAAYCHEAAAALEAAWKAHNDLADRFNKDQETITALRAENERFKEQGVRATRIWQDECEISAALRAENERWIRGLRAAKDARADHVDMILRKDQEIERLRAALEKIAGNGANYSPHDMNISIARSALAGEGE